jgi:hypothetical protein
MTRRDPAAAEDDLFDAIAKLLEPGQREYFYQRMLYFRHLRPEDELLRLVEAIGLLALLIREAPQAVAAQREQMAQLLETSIAAIRTAADAEHAYHQQLEDRLVKLPAQIAQGISPEAIARAITESVRQEFVRSGLPATAEALKAVSQQVTQATGHFQRAASELGACTGIAVQAQTAITKMTTSVATATDTAQWAMMTVRREFNLTCFRAVCLLCGAAWAFGVLGGLTFERWWICGLRGVPEALAIPAPAAEPPPPPAEPVTKKPAPLPARDRRRASSTPKPPNVDGELSHGTDVAHGSNGDGTTTGSAGAKPKA